MKIYTGNHQFWVTALGILNGRNQQNTAQTLAMICTGKDYLNKSRLVYR